MSSSRLDIVDLRKEFPGTTALDGVSLALDAGRVHALVGKNGAGKSTLVKILSGAVQPSSGAIRIDGRTVQVHSPSDALRQGIAAVYQELSLVPGLSVTENVLLGRLPHFQGLRKYSIDWRSAHRTARTALDQLGVEMDVTTPVRALGIAQQQFVEIAKAMSYRPSVLMLDEPTSALSHRETERLFQVIRTLAFQGVVVVYITHRLQELYSIADTISVLRNGALAGTIVTRDASPGVLAQMMFGQDIPKSRPAIIPTSAEPILQVRNLSRKQGFADISFTLNRGEILGIAGLLGSGRTELLRALSGAEPAEEGVVTVQGRSLRPEDPRQMKKLGVVLAPENRKDEGLIQMLGTRVNLCLASLTRISRGGMITRARERRVAEESIRTLAITVPDIEIPVSSLSGGNQQKVVIGKWLNAEPAVILLDEPTRGIDIQAKQQMFDIIWSLSKDGISSVVVSSELEELLEVCHRILVMRKGRLVGEVFPPKTTLEQLFTLCLEPNH